MANVADVAQYILEQCGEMTTTKLQKLIYYCQAWCLVWTEKTLFPDEIQAWANGPVVPSLYQMHQGQFNIDATAHLGNSNALTADEKESINIVLDTYAKKDTYWLVSLTHMEDPWKKARTRADVQVGERCTEVITLADMAEYYSGLQDGD